MAERPQLAIVVDTEEEFDWSRPFSRHSRSTLSIPAQAEAHRIYDRLGVVPTYVIDHPVATSEIAIDFLGSLQREGRAEIGAHLHPWVSPPHEEEVTARNSYHCNLPPALESAKIEALTETIERNFGRRPTVFKAGRYGFGSNTARTLAALGYEVDCSFVPHTSFARDGGPSYYRTPDQPFWLEEGRLLEVPLTNGHIGRLAPLGPYAQPLFDTGLARRLRMPGMLARTHLLSRSRLSPEGVPADEQCALLEGLLRRGRRFFTLTYHSPSLMPGNTSYVRTEAELETFLASIEQVLIFFRDSLGGEFTTLTALRRSFPADASLAA